MDSNIKLISRLFALSAILLAVAVFTITNTFCKPNGNASKVTWDVAFSDVEVDDEEANVIVTNDKIDFNVSLKKSGDTFSFITSIDNNGSFDAVLSNLKLTDLSTQVVGVSEDTGRTYYVSDYISYTVRYLDNNYENEIYRDADVVMGDKLKKNTKNNIIVTVKYKEVNRLTSDQVKVLNDNVEREDNYLVFNLDLNVSAIYQQL